MKRVNSIRKQQTTNRRSITNNITKLRLQQQPLHSSANILNTAYKQPFNRTNSSSRLNHFLRPTKQRLLAQNTFKKMIKTLDQQPQHHRTANQRMNHYQTRQSFSVNNNQQQGKQFNRRASKPVSINYNTGMNNMNIMQRQQPNNTILNNDVTVNLTKDEPRLVIFNSFINNNSVNQMSKFNNAKNSSMPPFNNKFNCKCCFLFF
jgi:hypothetical protein